MITSYCIGDGRMVNCYSSCFFPDRVLFEINGAHALRSHAVRTPFGIRLLYTWYTVQYSRNFLAVIITV